VLGHMEELRARNGYDGIVELGRIRAALEAELRTLDAERARREPSPV
jgi:hypothetical protein